MSLYEENTHKYSYNKGINKEENNYLIDYYMLQFAF